MHVRRGDTYWGALQLAVEVLWWFHPLVWWANRETCRQRERCCDEEVVAGLKYRPAAYARCLLDVLELERNWQPMLAVPGVRFMEVTSKRLEDIMNRSSSFRAKTPRWSWAVLIVAAVLVLPGRAMVLGQIGKNEPKETAAGHEPEESIPSVESPVAVLVVGPDGRPVERAEVQAYDAYVPLQSFRTNQHGVFRIPGKWLTPDGHMYLLVTRKGESVGWRWLLWPFQQSGDESRIGNRPMKVVILPRTRTLKGVCLIPTGGPLR